MYKRIFVLREMTYLLANCGSTLGWLDIPLTSAEHSRRIVFQSETKVWGKRPGNFEDACSGATPHPAAQQNIKMPFNGDIFKYDDSQ